MSRNYNLNEGWNSISLCKKGKRTWVMLLCQCLAEVVNLLEPGKWHTTLGKVKFKMTNKDQYSVSFSGILSIQYIGVEGILHTANRTKNRSTIRSNSMKFPLKAKSSNSSNNKKESVVWFTSRQVNKGNKRHQRNDSTPGFIEGLFTQLRYGSTTLPTNRRKNKFKLLGMHHNSVTVLA